MTTAPEGAATSVARSVAGMGAAAAVSRAFGGVRMVVIAGVLVVPLGVGGIGDFAPASQVVIGIPATGAGPPPDPVRAVLGVVAGGLFGSLAVWQIRTTDWGGGEE